MIRLIGVVFSNGTMLSVSGRSDSINERTHTDQQQNKITYSVGVSEVPMNKLGNWRMLRLRVCVCVHVRVC